MRKVRSDAKQIDLSYAWRQQWFNHRSIRDIARELNIHHTNLSARFRRMDMPYHPRIATIAPRLYGKDNPSWKGGQYTDQRGYVHVRINGKNRYLHRVIAEKALGRPLKKNEAVHHIDGNRSNNSNSNLLLCSTRYHHWLHAKMQNFLIGQNHKRRS